MPSKKQQPNGCGCLNIPLSVIIAVLGGGYWLFSQRENLDISKFIPNNQRINIPILAATPTPQRINIPTLATTPTASPTPRSILPSPQNLAAKNQKTTRNPIQSQKTISPPTPWEKKVIRGIYLTRYQATNNADEQTIRQRVRYYRSQGINTIIHGVWGNGCTMYKSEVMQQTLGYSSCPNQFQEQWLNWLIDEAHKQGMQVHAYFEKGIKIDENSPIFDLAVTKRWIVPGVDKTYAGIDHYVLDVQIPEVAAFFKNILVEFVKKYPNIDAVQWDDYLGYYAELPGKVDRTANLTNFVRQMTSSMKKANGSVSFDICHHNPYWAKKYFAADWEKWGVDRAFIQAYNDKNFAEELYYAQKYAGVAITDHQLSRLRELVNNPNIKSILVFPFAGKPEKTASDLKNSIKILTETKPRQ
ncbi:family 10 glycosylhydrolase [Nostoc sp. FACHB-152]|uniref:family 10 glycosylhydrolase n=1 Tax=unclassified Nostoc TaxID=2593658 RepID=UPI001689FF05|nr:MULTISPECIES: family 10 glycosylhydrolase [unclassified Nostoc]MBD2449409.1 family 10 glycosylhydrolase [Nostoc sp. FACHB-152]MBD2470676.1 family 10 glycosylhydrolase [Nostoc sp. FACHB-145]